MRSSALLSLLLFLLAFPPTAFATDGESTLISDQEVRVFITVHEAQTLIDQGARILDAREARDHRQQHLPQAASLPWSALVDGPRSGRLTDDSSALTSALQQAGVFQNRPVIIYGNWSADDAWGEEGRLYWTLDYLGHPQVFILAGGLNAWLAHNLPTDSNRFFLSPPQIPRGDFQPQPQPHRRIDTPTLRQTYQQDNLLPLDTREASEYHGTTKYGESLPGHIPGAVHLWWADLFDQHGQLLPTPQLRHLLHSRGITPDKQIVAYCTGGIRSGFVYAVLRALGYPHVQNYDASMWAWTRQPNPPLN